MHASRSLAIKLGGLPRCPINVLPPQCQLIRCGAKHFHQRCSRMTEKKKDGGFRAVPVVTLRFLSSKMGLNCGGVIARMAGVNQPTWGKKGSTMSLGSSGRGLTDREIASDDALQQSDGLMGSNYCQFHFGLCGCRLGLWALGYKIGSLAHASPHNWIPSWSSGTSIYQNHSLR